jgi:hypothetical protein
MLRAHCARRAVLTAPGSTSSSADLPRVVDVNPRPTTSIVGIAKVMCEELADLISMARFATLPERVAVEGRCEFNKEYIEM